MRLVIVGGGPAAVEAALAARTRDDRAEIVVVSREKWLPYRRPALSRMISRDLPTEQFFIKSAEFYREKRIAVKLGVAAAAIDRSSGQVRLADDSQESYDRLLLATGAHCRSLPVPGADLAGVLRYRDYDDVLALRSRIAAGAKKVAIVGGGLLGLELAEALLAAGCGVTILEAQSRLLPRQLDNDGSGILAAALDKVSGLTILTGRTLAEIVGKNHPEAIRLSDGGAIACDAVIMAPGVVPDIALAGEAGLAVGHGVVTDSALHTGDEQIFAAGDCAEISGMVSGLYAPAMAEGKIAGSNMTGAALDYAATPVAARLAAFGLTLVSAGDVGEALEKKTFEDPARGVWKRIFLHDGILVGGIILGDLQAAVKLGELLRMTTPGAAAAAALLA